MVTESKGTNETEKGEKADDAKAKNHCRLLLMKRKLEDHMYTHTSQLCIWFDAVASPFVSHIRSWSLRV